MHWIARYETTLSLEISVNGVGTIEYRPQAIDRNGWSGCTVRLAGKIGRTQARLSGNVRGGAGCPPLDFWTASARAPTSTRSV